MRKEHACTTWVLLTALFGFGGIGFADDLLKVLARNSKGLPGWAAALAQACGQPSLATQWAALTVPKG